MPATMADAANDVVDTAVGGDGDVLTYEQKRELFLGVVKSKEAIWDAFKEFVLGDAEFASLLDVPDESGSKYPFRIKKRGAFMALLYKKSGVYGSRDSFYALRKRICSCGFIHLKLLEMDFFDLKVSKQLFLVLVMTDRPTDGIYFICPEQYGYGCLGRMPASASAPHSHFYSRRNYFLINISFLHLMPQNTTQHNTTQHNTNPPARRAFGCPRRTHVPAVHVSPLA